MKLLLFYFLNISIVIASDNFTQVYELAKEKLTPKINSCINQAENVLKKSLIELDDCKKDLPCWKFIEDEKVALDLINQFDIQKVMIDEEQEIIRGLIQKNCTDENIKLDAGLYDKNVWCSNHIMLEYNYLRALIIAWDQYHWSQNLKEKAKGLVLTYLNTFLTRNKTLLSPLMGLQILKLMSSRSMINKNMLQKISATAEKSENASAKLSQQAKKINKNKKLSNCEKLIKISELEHATTINVKKDIEQILKKLSSIPEKGI
jgi:hypothetical protein